MGQRVTGGWFHLKILGKIGERAYGHFSIVPKTNLVNDRRRATSNMCWIRTRTVLYIVHVYRPTVCSHVRKYVRVPESEPSVLCLS